MPFPNHSGNIFTWFLVIGEFETRNGAFEVDNRNFGHCSSCYLIGCWLRAAVDRTALAHPLMPIVTEEPSVPISRVAVAQSVDIQILESFPLQVNAIVRGQLRDADCRTISGADQVCDGDTFKVSLTTTTDPLALCAQALTPFEQVVSPNVEGLPSSNCGRAQNTPNRHIRHKNIDSFQFVTRIKP